MEEIIIPLMISYYSRYIEIVRLSTDTSSNVITHMKSLFAYHGLPESPTLDNDIQYAADQFKISFVKEYSFKHLTSSP